MIRERRNPAVQESAPVTVKPVNAEQSNTHDSCSNAAPLASASRARGNLPEGCNCVVRSAAKLAGSGRRHLIPTV